MQVTQRATALLLTLILALAALAWGVPATAAGPAVADPATGTIYTLTNDATRNEVLAFNRAADGTLSMPRHFDTGGKGSGVFENSNTMLVLGSAAGQSSPVDLGGGADLLFAANAGSDEVSVFAIAPDGGLTLVDRQPSGGERPSSLTVRNGLLYAMNSAGDLEGAGFCLGGAPNISGFRVAVSGKLTPIPGSTKLLSGGSNSGCTHVTFTPKGDVLIVAQFVESTIDTFIVGADGVARGPIVNQPTGVGPFGLSFDKAGHLLTTEDFQVREGQSGVAAYTVGGDGRLAPIGGTVRNGETDACWFVVTPDGQYGYVTNFGPLPIAGVKSEASRRGTISSFRIGADGTLTLLAGQAAQVGVGAADEALGGGGRYLYALNTLAGTISGFRVEANGGLTLITSVGGIPTGSVGPSGGLVSRDAAPGAPMPGGGPSQFFPQTGMTVSGRFLAYWQAHGGLAIHGYPLTAPRMETLEDGKTYEVQYFERSRLEYHPENGVGRDVLLGQFGRRIHSADPAAQPIAGQTYFTETGHNVGGRFLEYWKANGALADFGFPITEPFMETLDGKAYTVQYFERARFELHPENAAPYDVLLGQFGRQILAQIDGAR
jgi:6-phosphogluconolactonase